MVVGEVGPVRSPERLFRVMARAKLSIFPLQCTLTLTLSPSLSLSLSYIHTHTHTHTKLHTHRSTSCCLHHFTARFRPGEASKSQRLYT